MFAVPLSYLSIDQSLAVANKATFRNCLVTMRPKAIKADLPSTHDIQTYIHNQFVAFFNKLKAKFKVSTDLNLFLPFDF